MNPRHRRLLIPGLLVLLLVVVVLSSLAGRGDAAESAGDPVSRLSDPAITESSGLVVSARDDDLVYTVNDSGNDAEVFAVQLSTGATVGTFEPDVEFTDTEALSIDSAGTLWIADTGDNDRERTDTALYAVDEPGPGAGQAVTATRYPLSYPDGPRDVESLVINPRTDEKFLLTKGLLGGDVYALPDELGVAGDNAVKDLGVSVPALLTDAAFTPDGRYVVARDLTGAFVLDPSTWQVLDSRRLPPVEQGETLAMEAGGRSYLVGSEGEDSPLIRVPFAAPRQTGTTTPGATPGPGASDDSTPASQEPPSGGNGFAGNTWLWAAIVVGLLTAISVAATRRR